jgi:hypothetical protein
MLGVAAFLERLGIALPVVQAGWAAASTAPHFI